jgi:ABC-type multidrug transport system ATPase subunit
VAKRYAGGIVALDGVDLAIARGTVTAIIGANGSGKSTLLKMLAGIVRPDAGLLARPGPRPRPLAHLSCAMRSWATWRKALALDPEMSGRRDHCYYLQLCTESRQGQAQSRIVELSLALDFGNISTPRVARIPAACANLAHCRQLRSSTGVDS